MGADGVNSEEVEDPGYVEQGGGSDENCANSKGDEAVEQEGGENGVTVDVGDELRSKRDVTEPENDEDSGEEVDIETLGLASASSAVDASNRHEDQHEGDEIAPQEDSVDVGDATEAGNEGHGQHDGAESATQAILPDMVIISAEEI